MFKKCVGVALLLLGFLLLAPQTVDARENTSLALFEYIDEIEEELVGLTSIVFGEVAGESITVPALSRSLYIGLRDVVPNGDVSQLQQFLKEQGDFDYPEITGYFGPVTEQAVKRWQSRNKVVSSGTPASTGYGVVGPKTRLKIREAGSLDFEAEDEFDFDFDLLEDEDLDDAVEDLIPPTEEGAPIFLSGRMIQFRDPIKVGDKVVFIWEAEDPDGDNISWSVDWGDRSGQDSDNAACSGNGSSNIAGIAVQKFVAVHAWDKAGEYSVEAFATDCDGHTTFGYEHTFRVAVGVKPTSGSIIKVEEPNGGEYWERGSKESIEWDSKSLTSSRSSVNIKLYSVSSGCYEDQDVCHAMPDGLIPIALNTRNDGQYSWRVAETMGEVYLPDGLYKIRIEDSRTGKYDDSDRAFKIYTDDSTSLGKIELVSPNGGEEWRNDGKRKTVKWETKGIPLNARMTIGIQHSFTGRDYVLAESTRNDNRESVLLPVKAPTGAYLMYIKTEVDGEAIVDWSDGKFEIKGNIVNDHTPTASTSGPLRVIVGEQDTWGVNAQDKKGHELEFYVDWDDESPIERADSRNITRESDTSWHVTFDHTYREVGEFTPEFLVRDETGTEIEVTADVVVQGEGKPYLYVKKPSGGEYFNQGSPMTITWGSENYPNSAPVDITLREILPGSHLGLEYKVIKGTPNDGYFRWSIPSYVKSSNYKIYVMCGSSSYSQVGCTGRASQDTFTIGDITTAGEINVQQPDGGEVFVRGEVENMVWTNGMRTDVDLLLIPDTRYHEKIIRESYTIAKNVDWTTSPKQVYPWQVGEFLESNTYLRTIPDGYYYFEVCPINTEKDTNCGISNNSFQISSLQAEGKIEIEEPDFGETLVIGSPYKVEWDYVGSIPSVDIYLKSIGGSNCSGLVCTNVYYPETRYQIASGAKNYGYFNMITGLTLDTRLLPAGPYILEVCDSSSDEVCGSVSVNLDSLSLPGDGDAPLSGTRGSLDEKDLATLHALDSLLRQLAGVVAALK